MKSYSAAKETAKRMTERENEPIFILDLGWGLGSDRTTSLFNVLRTGYQVATERDLNTFYKEEGKIIGIATGEEVMSFYRGKDEKLLAITETSKV